MPVVLETHQLASLSKRRGSERWTKYLAVSKFP